MVFDNDLEEREGGGHLAVSFVFVIKSVSPTYRIDPITIRVDLSFPIYISLKRQTQSN